MMGNGAKGKGKGYPPGKGFGKAGGMRGGFEGGYGGGSWQAQEMDMFNMMMAMKGKGYEKGMQMARAAAAATGKGGKGGKAAGRFGKGGSSGSNSVAPWKAQLVKQVEKTSGREAVHSIAYTTEAEGDMFISSVTCDAFPSVYVSNEAQKSKKLAEESAAMVAVENEFADYFSKIPEKQRTVDAAGQQSLPQKAPKAKSTPQPISENDSRGQDPKSMLNMGITILAQKSLRKGDVVYEATKNSEGIWNGTVHVKIMEGSPSFEGAPGSTQKEAEAHAAVKALEHYQAEIDIKLPEHQAAKEAREREQREKAAAEGKMFRTKAEKKAGRGLAGEPALKKAKMLEDAGETDLS